MSGRGNSGGMGGRSNSGGRGVKSRAANLVAKHSVVTNLHPEVLGLCPEG